MSSTVESATIELTEQEADELAAFETFFKENPLPADMTYWQKNQMERELFNPADREEIEKIRQENEGYIGEETLLDCAYGVRFAPGK